MLELRILAQAAELARVAWRYLEAERLIEKALALPCAETDPAALYTIHYCAAAMATEKRDAKQCVHHSVRALRAAERLRDPVCLAAALVRMAYAHVIGFRMEAAMDCLRRSTLLNPKNAWSSAWLLGLHQVRGEGEAAEAVLRDMADSWMKSEGAYRYESANAMLYALSWAAVWAGSDPYPGLIDEIATFVRAHRPAVPAHLVSLHCRLGEVALARSEREGVQRHFASAQRLLDGRRLSHEEREITVGRNAAALAGMAFHLGYRDKAFALFETGCELERRSPSRLPAIAYLSYAQALLESGADGNRARSLMAEGNAVADRLGLTAVVARFDALVARMDENTPGRRARLTARELQVLSELVRGTTNQEIGKELRISEHTVANHVANIRRKLDAESRTEAVARAFREGLVAGN
jgi:DNA-binding CsgD family transcriptional regulator